MPRLMHRIGQRFRSQDWVAAASDLAIVVVGVFLGIEAANWNADRQQRSEERRYYAQIVEDLRTDQLTFATALARSAAFDIAAEQTLAALGSGSPGEGPPSRTALQIHYAGFLYLPRAARWTYDELISTGNIGLLRNDPAKTAIAEYYAKFDESRQWDELLRRQQDRYWSATAGVLPRPLLRAAIRNEEPNITSADAEAIMHKARARPEIADLLVAMAAHQERVRRDSSELSRRGRELIAKLEPLARSGDEDPRQGRN